MIEDAQITAILSPALAAAVPGDEANIIAWLHGEGWKVQPRNGVVGRLNELAHDTLEAAAKDEGSGLVATILRQYRQSIPAIHPSVGRAALGPPAGKAQAAPGKPKPEAADPRREYDDETLGGIVLQLLRANRREEYTYNQVADDASAWCDWKAASRVLRRMAERGNDIIQYDVKKPNGGKARVYKYAPERKALDRDYSRAQEIVGGAILEHLEDHCGQSQIAICGAMRLFFGYIDKGVVKDVLENLRVEGKLIQTVGPRNAKVFALPILG